jgi:hypothetical protein
MYLDSGQGASHIFSKVSKSADGSENRNEVARFDTNGNFIAKKPATFESDINVKRLNYNTIQITVAGQGDGSTFYPVRIKLLQDKDHPSLISVWRNLGFNDIPLFDEDNIHGTNKSSSLWLLYEGRTTTWDGNGGFIRCIHRSDEYGILCAHASTLSNGCDSLIVWLRGGKITYNISADYDLTDKIEVYYQSTNIGSEEYPINISPQTTIGNKGIIGGTWYGSLTLTDETTGDSLVSINTSGIKAPSFNATSDARLKENFQPLTLEKSILDLPTYKFDFINGAKNQIGCKAQDLQEICPEIVSEGDDGMLSIQESKIVYLLLDEIKKLREEVDELKRGS